MYTVSRGAFPAIEKLVRRASARRHRPARGTDHSQGRVEISAGSVGVFHQERKEAGNWGAREGQREEHG